MEKSFRYIVFAIISLALFTGCATQPVSRCVSPGDTPQQHYIAGMEALEQNRFDLAREKFERALYCDEEFSLAYGGFAIVYAYRASSQKDPNYSSAERKKAIEFVDKAKKIAETQEEKFAYYMAIIRVNTYMDGEKWLAKTEDAYKTARSLSIDEGRLLYYRNAEALDYFMGLAWLRAHEFQNARNIFRDVLNARSQGKWQGYADRAWKKTDKVERALAGTTIGEIGKRIAVQDTVARGDLATVLVTELKIDKLFAGRISQSQNKNTQQEFTPADIANYPFKEEVATVMKWKVRGLEPKYDEAAKAYFFKPADTVKRGEMAFVLEDVLMRITGDEKMAIAFLGNEKSPFPDVKPTSQFYNAIMNMASRGIMESGLSGEFRVDAPVEGADVILALRVLKQKLNINE